jgi:carboxymethylenebutenolidase
MAEMVKFPRNGTEGQGYLATPPSGSGPGVVVLQEWWGVNDQIKEV